MLVAYDDLLSRNEKKSNLSRITRVNESCVVVVFITTKVPEGEETPLILNLQLLDPEEAQLNFLEGKYRTSQFEVLIY